MRKPEKVLSVVYLQEKLWGDDLASGKKRNLRSNIQLLKHALPHSCCEWIVNVRGEGYILKKGGGNIKQDVSL